MTTGDISYYKGHSEHACTVCGGEPATMDGAAGFRCAQHPPDFCRRHLLGLLLDGLPGAALAYARSFPLEDPTAPRAGGE